MKKLLIFLVIGLFLAVAFAANADIIGTVELEETASSPTGSFYFDNLGTYNVYLDYGAVIDGQTYEAFCVEDAWALSGSNTYTLLEVNDTLEDNTSDFQKYEQAAWIAESYYLTDKAAAQIAIWELMFDDTVDLSTGNFYVVNVDEDILNVAKSIVDSLNSIPVVPSSNWVLAVNPTIGENDQFGVESSQNYLIRRVPEPTQMLLFGTGLIVLAGIGRKRFFK